MYICYQAGMEVKEQEVAKIRTSCHYSLGSVPFQEVDEYFGLDWKDYKFDNAFTAYVDHKLYECMEDRL
jgi:hypothetical protein